ncbi:MAG TPA: shikimate dehydrogenase [Actinophytocola sp.]|uniref:shikimate dehydrogenase n=1 Tax=Actinophytocola sp. TaxID=1872138 RepID=UPI002DDD15C5|nr:shikimate dehydrogenase [Actinophytocola sp.]HEV2779648.1 shikimate dehydrogenase [Actinophytocola sp.]
MPTERRRAAVVGSPVAHSLSPVLHLAAYQALGLSGWTYDRIERDAAGMPSLVSSLDDTWAGLSVTMPGKQAALRLASSATPRATAVGAANTLVRQDSGGWHADCSDVDGVVGALRAAGGYEGVDGITGVVLGAGGTACAALAGLVELGVPEASVVVRDPSRADAARACADRLGLSIKVVRWSGVDFADLLAGPAVLVNTAPAGAIESSVDTLARAAFVLDVIYHPWPTLLATAVQQRGGRIATGLDMLLHQAFTQVELFTGRPAPRPAMRDALRAATGGVLDLPLGPDPDERFRAVTVGELKPFATKVIIEPYNPEWPAWYAADEAAIRAALGPRALRVEHTGSTSVPGLPAKPIIDILLLVADPADEPAYVPDLERAGYKLRAREPNWYEHRVLRRRTDEGDPHDVNLHVFAPDTAAPEIDRMLTFRDWLRTHSADRDHYARTKLQLSTRTWRYVQDYADAKTAVIEEILTRAAAARR